MENKRQPVSRDLLVTIGDLEQFKIELLDAIGRLLKGNYGQQANKPWLKTREVSKLLGISPGKLLTLRQNNTLPYTRVGGIIYYKTEDIHKLFDQAKRTRP